MAYQVTTMESNTSFKRQPIYAECPLSLVDDPNDTNFSIRLVELLPGEGDQTINCRFVLAASHEHESLKKYEYTALTYASGDTTFLQPILVNGKLFGIPSNLLLALKHLRSPTESVFLWVGGICINYLDLAEKSWHATHNKLIFTRAARVVAWLGEEGEHTAEALGQLRDAERIAVEPEENNTVYGGLVDLAGRDFWKRLWPLTEVAFADDVQAMCGADTIPISVLIILARKLWEGEPALYRAFCQLARFGYLASHARAWDHQSGGGGDRHHPDDAAVALSAMMAIHSFNEPDVVTEEHDKLFALHGVFSLLPYGVPLPDYTKSPLDALIDFLAVAVHHPGGLDFLFCFPVGHPAAGGAANSPSWAPLIGAEQEVDTTFPRAWERQGLFNACGRFGAITASVAVMAPDNNNNNNNNNNTPAILTVKGEVVSTVTKVMGPLLDPAAATVNDLRRRRRRGQTTTTTTTTETEGRLFGPGPGAPSLEAFRLSATSRLASLEEVSGSASATTACGQAGLAQFFRMAAQDFSSPSPEEPSAAPLSPEALASYHAVWTAVESAEKRKRLASLEAETLATFWRTFAALRGKEFVSTKSGACGLVSSLASPSSGGVRKGDLVVVFFGCVWPMVVREVGPGSGGEGKGGKKGGKKKGGKGKGEEEDGGRYRLIGPAYIAGAMKGERLAGIEREFRLC